MPRGVPNKKSVKHRRIPKENLPNNSPSNPFILALQAAEISLKTAVEERDRCVQKLHHFSIEIPRLEQTISALRQQMQPTKSVATAKKTAPYIEAKSLPVGVSTIPQVSLPPEAKEKTPRFKESHSIPSGLRDRILGDDQP